MSAQSTESLRQACESLVEHGVFTRAQADESIAAAEAWETDRLRRVAGEPTPANTTRFRVEDRRRW